MCPECLEHSATQLGLPEVTDQSGASADAAIDLAAMDEMCTKIFSTWSKPHFEMMLAGEPDFKGQKSRLQEYIESRGHICFMNMKFHCDTMLIEFYWAKQKRWTCEHMDGTWRSLKEALWRAYGCPDSLQDDDEPFVLPTGDSGSGVIGSLFRQRASRKAREMMVLYYNNKGKSGEEVASELRPLQKAKRSHRRPSVRAGLMTND